MRLIQPGNSKLVNQYMFNIPATRDICGRVCPGCYAHKFAKLYPNVLPAQEKRYEASLQPDFAAVIIKELNAIRKPITTFRIHGSAGEFYSQQYIDAWHTIATALPQFTFYAFTKRLRDFDFVPLMALPNVIIIDSLMHGFNYGKASKLSPTVFTCPSTLGKPVVCGVTCRYCMTKTAQTNGIQFVQH